jgi:hypothetical protein
MPRQLEIEPQVVFVIGCQRSGTTLMRLVLEAHSKIECFDEIEAYSLLAGLGSPTFRKPILAFKIPRWTEQLDLPLLWDYGLPERAQRIYSGQKILFMVRDVLDTVSSMLKLKIAGQTWLEHYGIPILQAKAAQDKRFAQQFSKELETIQRAHDPSISVAALYWKYKTEALLGYFQKGYPVLPIYYEDLTRQPEVQLREVCRFLNVAWEDSLLDHPRIVHREVFENGLTVGDTDPKRSIDRTSVGQWRQHLTEEQVAQIATVVASTPHALASAIKSWHAGHQAEPGRTKSASYRSSAFL